MLLLELGVGLDLVVEEGRAKAEGLGRWVRSWWGVGCFSSVSESESSLFECLAPFVRDRVTVDLDVIVAVAEASFAALTSFSIWYRSLLSRGLTPFSR